jgi:hypothetical protein
MEEALLEHFSGVPDAERLVALRLTIFQSLHINLEDAFACSCPELG